MRLAVFLLCLTVSAYAQRTLQGQVVSAADAQPVPFCSVFLANTTKGTTADEQGHFVLHNVPAGRLEVVASSVGFDTKATTLPTDQADAMLIRLRPVARQLAEVAIRASRDPDWLKNLNTFRDLFIGTSANARQCTILNQHTLWFDDDRAAQTLTVGAREPLLISNNALGYLITYSLTRFVFDYGHHYLTYLGYPMYEPMKPRSRRVAAQWEKARRATYLGSAMHFMRALHTRQLDEAGFELRRILERADSTRTGTACLVKKNRYLLPDKLPGTFLIQAEASTASATVLAFENPIHVTYTREKEPAEYRPGLSPTAEAVGAAGPQISIIYLTRPAVTVEPTGNFYDQLALVFEGYWGWEKVADMLPLTYQP